MIIIYIFIYAFALVLLFRQEFYWWKGQNQRTFQIGLFPRLIADRHKPITGEDISKPLRNSFIHTGHGDISGQSWGNPGHIDE